MKLERLRKHMRTDCLSLRNGISLSAAKCEEEIFSRLKEALSLEQRSGLLQCNFDFHALFGRIGQKENAFSHLDLFDASVLGLTFMDQPIDYVRENQSYNGMLFRRFGV